MNIITLKFSRAYKHRCRAKSRAKTRKHLKRAAHKNFRHHNKIRLEQGDEEIFVTKTMVATERDVTWSSRSSTLETPFYLEKDRRAAKRRHHQNRKKKNARSVPHVKSVLDPRTEHMTEKEKQIFLGKFVTTPQQNSAHCLCCSNPRKSFDGKKCRELTKTERISAADELVQILELQHIEPSAETAAEKEKTTENNPEEEE